jgi:hypothetical protein
VALFLPFICTGHICLVHSVVALAHSVFDINFTCQ